MGLPSVAMPTAMVAVGDEKLEVRGMSRGEVVRMSDLGDVAAMEAYAISVACGVPEDEAAAWRDTTPCSVVDAVTQKIAELTGLGGLGNGSSGA